MPKIKECPHCHQVLYCKACGVRFTPDLANRTRIHTLVDNDTLHAIHEEAKKEGVSINVMLKRKYGAKKSASSRRRACSD